MILLDLENASTRLRGKLNLWLQEIRAGVFVGDYSERFREEIWEYVEDNLGTGNAILIWDTNNEQGYDFLMAGVNRRQPVEQEGLKLIKFDGNFKTKKGKVINSISPWAYNPDPEKQLERAPVVSATDLIDKTAFGGRKQGRGKELGNRVHVFGELYAEGRAVSPDKPGLKDKENLKNFLDQLNGELKPEVACSLTVERKNGEPQCLEIRGIIDLVVTNGNELELIDYKTNPDLEGIAEYQKQLSAYYYAMLPYYEDCNISLCLYFTQLDRKIDIEPLAGPRWEEIIWKNYHAKN